MSRSNLACWHHLNEKKLKQFRLLKLTKINFIDDDEDEKELDGYELDGNE